MLIIFKPPKSRKDYLPNGCTQLILVKVSHLINYTMLQFRAD